MPTADPQNPLLETSDAPAYDRIRAAHAEPAIRRRVEQAEALVETLAAGGDGTSATWEGFIAPLADAEDGVDRAWSVLQNLDATLGTPEIREARRVAQEVMSRHHARMGQDDRLYRVYRSFETRADDLGLDPVRRKVVADQLRNFRLAGVHLETAGKERCAAIRTELAKLGSAFADNVTDDSKSRRLVVSRREQVEGLPAPLVDAARARALADDPAAPAERWTFSLDASVVLPFTSNQADRSLREEMQRLWTTRASADPFDNAPLVRRILTLRKELAHLLGFQCYAELSLVPKMARTPAEVRAFLLDLADRALPNARREVAGIAEAARRRDGIEDFARHDFPYYREQLRQQLHGFSQEELRPYFPLPRVLRGVAEVLRRLYGVTLTDRTEDGVLATWHPDVRVLEIADGGAVCGHILFDPCARGGKRAGAWVSTCVPRHRSASGRLARPVSHLVCNFPAAAPGRPPLLSHDEVRTLFHEFGHALHAVLTTVEHRSVAGTHGVPWDGVEFPSQFHENWIWHPESLALVGGHVDTGEPLPAELLAKLRASRDFCAASDLLRQVELALFDLELHTDFDPARDDVHATIEAVRRRVAVIPAPPWDRFENSFQHVFQGAYAAGYYGYKWAEVLAADAFGRFEEEGIFAEGAAREFREHVLSKGGSEDFLSLFVRFRGREPDPAALLRQCGIV